MKNNHFFVGAGHVLPLRNYEIESLLLLPKIQIRIINQLPLPIIFVEASFDKHAFLQKYALYHEITEWLEFTFKIAGLKIYLLLQQPIFFLPIKILPHYRHTIRKTLKSGQRKSDMRLLKHRIPMEFFIKIIEIRISVRCIVFAGKKQNYRE